MDEDKKANFWKSLLRAVETEPRNVELLKGTTGLSYPIIALGVEDSRRRLVIISGESDARSAAIAHADIQATMPGTKVIMVRPVAINLAIFAELLAEIIGTKKIGNQEWEWLFEHSKDIKNAAENLGEDLRRKSENYDFIKTNIASVNWASVFKNIVNQIFLVKARLEKTRSVKDKNGNIHDKHMPNLDLSPLINNDPTEEDRNLGVCPIPLYSFSENQAEIFHSGSDIEQIREILRLQDVFQYFFPPPDHLALGLIEKTTIIENELLHQLKFVPVLGHPFGKHEIISEDVSIVDLIDSLKSEDFMVEGETGVEITPKGKFIRASVKFKPREGFLKKLSNIFSLKLNVSLKDLLK